MKLSLKGFDTEDIIAGAISGFLLIIFSLVVNLSSPYQIDFGPVHYKFPGIDLKKVFITRDLSFHRGLDLEGGTNVTLKADMKDIPESQRNDALDSAKTVIEKRINFFGVSVDPMVISENASKICF